MTDPQSRSFDGCRTRAEARARLEAWLAQIHHDNLHQLRMDLFAARDNGEIVGEGDPEEVVGDVDDAVAAAREYSQESIGPTMARFDASSPNTSHDPPAPADRNRDRVEHRGSLKTE